MADTVNESLVKVTEELKEANQRSLEASKELGKVTAASKSGASSIGSAVKEAVGLDKLESTIMSLPGMNVAKAIKDAIFKKKARIRDEKNLAKRLGITREQLVFQVKEQELLQARENESKVLIEAAEKLGFNTDRIARVNEDGNAELNGTLRESNGQFVSRANASADANLAALKDFSGNQEKTLSEGIGSMVSAPSVDGGPSGASLSEDAGEDRRVTQATLNESEKQTSLLQQIVDGILDGNDSAEESGGGLLSKMGNLRLAMMGVGATVGGFAARALTKVKGVGGKIAGGVRAAGRGVAKGAGAVAKGAGGIAKGAGGIAKVAGKGLLRGAAGAAKFIPGIGLAVTAAMGIFDGMSAGIEEYKKSGKLGAAVKEGIAGAASGLTFGLVSQESISAGMDKIGTFFSDGWTSFTSGVGKIAGGIADFAKDPLGTLSEVGTALSTKFSETVTSIKDGASALNTKFADLTGIDVGAGFAATAGLIKSGAAALGTKFTELTGITIPTDFASLKTGIITGATALGTKFTELTGITIPTDFASLKTSIVTGAAALGTKFTELTGIDIGASLTGAKDKILGLGTKVADGFNGLFGEEGFSVAGVKTAISGIAGAVSGKFTELTGVNLPSFASITTGIAGIGTAVATGLGSLGVPTFAEVTGKMSGIGTSIATGLGALSIPTFSEAGSAMSGLAEGLGNKISGMWDSVTSLFSSADKKQSDIDKMNALDESKESGLYTTRRGRDNLLDQSKISEASDVQLQAILDDTKGTSVGGTNDMSSENIAALEEELAARKINTELKVETNKVESKGTELKVETNKVESKGTELKVETNKVESDALKVKVFGKEYTKEELIQARKDGTVKRSIATSKIRELDMMEKREQMNEADVTSGTFVQGKLVTPPESTHKMTDGSIMKDSDMKGSSSPLGMGSESITNSVVNSAATANATTSNLTYIPSKLDTTNNISSNSVSTNDMPAGAVMQADTVMINTQKTVALREQGLDTQQAVAMAPMIFQSKSSSNVTNNVSTTKPMMMPVPVSNTGDGGFNFSNG